MWRIPPGVWVYPLADRAYRHEGACREAVVVEPGRGRRQRCGRRARAGERLDVETAVARGVGDPLGERRHRTGGQQPAEHRAAGHGGGLHGHPPCWCSITTRPTTPARHDQSTMATDACSGSASGRTEMANAAAIVVYERGHSRLPRTPPRDRGPAGQGRGEGEGTVGADPSVPRVVVVPVEVQMPRPALVTHESRRRAPTGEQDVERRGGLVDVIDAHHVAQPADHGGATARLPPIEPIVDRVAVAGQRRGQRFPT